MDTYRLHNKSVFWLENSLQESKTAINIVVTHHAPCILSVAEENKEDAISTAYATNLEGLIERYQPNYWIHGHIHTPSRYNINQTEVICNPHGYIMEEYNGYEKELIVEVG